MSTQSIQERHVHDYSEKFGKITKWNADRHFMYSTFRIGEEMNYLEAMFYNKMRKIFCSSETCQLVDYIKLKLEGKLEELRYSRDTGYSVDTGLRPSLQELLQQAQEELNCTTQTDCITTCWQQTAW